MRKRLWVRGENRDLRSGERKRRKEGVDREVPIIAPHTPDADPGP